MRAWNYREYGGVEQLRLESVADPKPGPGTVRIRVHAASVNPVDWKLLAGGLAEVVPTHFPATIGWDVAGVVDALGFEVDNSTTGDPIIADNMQDVVWRGTMAEYAIVPLRVIARKPPELGFAEGAALPLAGQTAFQGVRRLGVSGRDTLLVHNASGGVGSVAVQYARHLGARVIATASERSHEWLRSIGAEPVRYGEGLVDAVRALVPGGVDAVFDAVGGVLDASLAVLAPEGRLLSIADPGFVEHGGQWEWVRPNTEDLTALASLASRRIIAPRIAETFPFEHADDAYRRSIEGGAGGKLVVRMLDD